MQQPQMGYLAAQGPPMGWRPMSGPGVGPPQPQAGPSPYGVLVGPRGGGSVMGVVTQTVRSHIFNKSVCACIL
jgi:hypothetical protein